MEKTILKLFQKFETEHKNKKILVSRTEGTKESKMKSHGILVATQEIYLFLRVQSVVP